MKVLVTGATGFIGKNLVNKLIDCHFQVSVLVRRKIPNYHESVDQFLIDPDNDSNLLNAFLDVHCVVHLAGIAHMKKKNDELEGFLLVNRDLTLNLARLAEEGGVKRFIFLSSIGVNGINSTKPFTEQDNVLPYDSYSISKYKAEIGLLDLAENSNMEVVIIRPPLVYGPGAPGSFELLTNWIRRSRPIPFSAISNRRSFVALDNLLDFILLCVDKDKSAKASNKVFLISDDEDISTSDFLKRISKAYGVENQPLPVPAALARLALELLNRKKMASRLFGDLQVDISNAKNILGWKPVVTMVEQLEKVAKYDNTEGKSQ